MENRCDFSHHRGGDGDGKSLQCGGSTRTHDSGTTDHLRWLRARLGGAHRRKRRAGGADGEGWNRAGSHTRMFAVRQVLLARCIFFAPGILPGYRVSGRAHLFHFMKTVRIQGLASVREEKLVDASLTLLAPLQDTARCRGAGARSSRMHLFYSRRYVRMQGFWPGASFLFHEDCPDTGSRQRS